MKNICLTITLVFAQFLNAQTTYTWNVANGNFLTPSSWTPARTSPAENDVLVFDGTVQVAPIVNNLSTQTIGRLLIKNNAAVNFNSAVPDTLTGIITDFSTIIGNKVQVFNKILINDVIADSSFFVKDFVKNFINDSSFITEFNRFKSTNNPIYVPKFILPKLVIKSKSNSLPAFMLEEGSQLALNSVPASLNIFLDTGTFAEIKGTLSISGKSSTLTSNSSLSGIDSNSIRIKSTGNISVYNFANSFNFGNSGNAYATTFDSGSVAYAGVTFSLKRVIFNKGSNYVIENGGLSVFKYANVTIKNVTSLLFGSENNPSLNLTEVENLIIEKGSQYIWSCQLNIKGSVTILSGARLLFYSSWGNQSANTVINFNGDQPQYVGGGVEVVSNNIVPVKINFKNAKGIFLSNNLNLGNANVSLDSGFINLNGYNLTIGKDSINYGNLKANKGYITGNGTVTKWLPANKTVTNNLDSTLFPFGITSQSRCFWLSGNFTQAGTLTISYNNIAGYSLFSNPFNDSLSNSLLVNARQNYNWQVTKSASLKGNNLTINALGQLDSNFINIPNNARLTLNNGKAPGSFSVGTLFNTLPLAIRTGITDSVLNNTFYLGANGNYCSEPEPPKVSASSICYGNKVFVKASGKGKISWFTDSIGGQRLINDSIYNSPNLTQTTFYYVQDSTCTLGKRSKVKVEVLPKPNVSINANATVICQGQTITLRGNGAKTYNWNNNVINNEPFKPTVNTSYKLIGIDSNGCVDSAFINVVVNLNPSATIQATENPVCAKTAVKLTANGGNLYFWSDGIINGQSFVPVGSKTYNVTVFDEKGCSDTASIKLEVKPLPNVEITKNKTVLTATLSGANYQWINCNNKTIIVGATNQIYTALSNGNYSVIIIQNGCRDTSTCININSVGINENDFKTFSIFPNPATSKLNITNSSNIKTVLVYNITGQLVKEFYYENNNLKDVSLAIDELAQGMYMVQIIDELDAKLTSKFIKQ